MPPTCAGGILGINPARSSPGSPTARRSSSTSLRKADPELAARLAERNIRASASTARSAASIRSARSARRCSATRASTTTASRGSSSRSTVCSTGRPGSETIVKDPIGRAIDVVSSTPAREGRDVYLTLDHDIQANAEAVLAQTMHQWRAKAATAIVLDPRNGAMLAMASAPTYDANKFADVTGGIARRTAP